MGILDLADELLRIILEHIASEPEKLISLERRAYLSQESFKAPPPLEPDQAQTIAAFRLTCRKFSDLGVIHQFSRVTTRFSRRGLKRLESIASQPHIAGRVKKFSYMVPFFYVEGRERVQELLRGRPPGLGSLDVSHFQQKVNEQKEIVSRREDARVLNLAISAFTSLQHVQILRVQDQADGRLLSYIRDHHELNHLVELRWPPACEHRYVQRSLNPETFHLNTPNPLVPCLKAFTDFVPCGLVARKRPQSVLGAASNPPTTLSVLAERLTCLELHFDDGTDLDVRMRELSPLSKAIFTAAKNIEALHIGFPSHRPLTLKLEEIFHNVKWDKLQAFGVQAWRLDADEIIGLAKRHRETLRGLRLRDVLLKEGSRWKDVLSFLRDGMTRLDWVSLRRIDYERHFDEQWVVGAEVPDDPLGSESSDESDDWDLHDDDPDDIPNDTLNHDPEADGSDVSFADSDSDADTDEPEQGGILHLPYQPMSPGTPASVPWCNCNGHLDSVDQLEDDGILVTYLQRKHWEKWVLKICADGHK